jgi:Tetracyclin repressor-like, C-terminal domain
VQPQRLGGADLAAGQDQLAGDRAADQVVQRPVDDRPLRGLGMGERRAVRGDAQVAQDGEVEPAASNRGMYELMFRHDLLESGRLGLREVSLPLFRMVTALVSDAEPPGDAAPEVVAGALWASLHGIAQLWGWGSLQLATGLADVEPLLRAALDAHLGTGR